MKLIPFFLDCISPFLLCIDIEKFKSKGKIELSRVHWRFTCGCDWSNGLFNIELMDFCVEDGRCARFEVIVQLKIKIIVLLKYKQHSLTKKFNETKLTARTPFSFAYS